MSINDHVKGGSCYNMTKWLLDHYLEFSELDTSFSNSGKELGGITRVPIVSHRKSFVGIICDLMFESLNYLDESGHKYAQVLFIHYFSEKYAMMSVADRIAAMGYTSGGYYNLLYKGIEHYSIILWDAIDNNRTLPFYMYDMEGKKAVVDRMKEALNLHSAGNSCYIDTERILKNYTRIKYFEVMETPVTARESSVAYGGDVYIPSDSTESSYMDVISDSMNRLRRTGEYGRDCMRFLQIAFFDPGIRDKPWKTKMKILGMSPRTYYKEREKAISMMSEIIWGSLGEKHYRSPFFEKRLL